MQGYIMNCRLNALVNHYHYQPVGSFEWKFLQWLLIALLVWKQSSIFFPMCWRAKLPENKQVEGNMWIRMFLHEHMWIQLLLAMTIMPFPLCLCQAETNKDKQGDIFLCLHLVNVKIYGPLHSWNQMTSVLFLFFCEPICLSTSLS